MIGNVLRIEYGIFFDYVVRIFLILIYLDLFNVILGRKREVNLERYVG